nr:hypothetical protein [Tanacetum cinerariifolium]
QREVGALGLAAHEFADVLSELVAPVPAVLAQQPATAPDENELPIVEPLHGRAVDDVDDGLGRVAHRQQRRLNGARRRAAHPRDVRQHAPAFQLLQRPAVGNAPNAPALHDEVAVGRVLGLGGRAVA